jgi:tight adherence protein B
MSELLIIGAAFIGVATLVGGVAILLRDRSGTKLEDRLDQFTGTNTSSVAKEAFLNSGVLAQPLDAGTGLIEEWLSRVGNIRMLLEQADSKLKPPMFVAVSGGMAAAGAVLVVLTGIPLIVVPVVAAGFAALPLLYLLNKRKRRMKRFAVQLPDALELISRALRAGHSLGSGFNLVQTEMLPPISTEFGRVFEEQNLNIPLDEALQALARRIPNLDLKFFCTAVVLQRQTGGDLAEILDKIGYLVRERFKIWGQIQALTGEGRLSGIVLLGLPPCLAAAVYYLNPTYLKPLFIDPMGHKMLGVTIVLQIVGALVIKKIINIKV